LAKTCTIDRLIQTTRNLWRESGSESSAGSASSPLVLPHQSTAACGLQSANEFTDWSLTHDDIDGDFDDTRMAAA
jgi:hypothetical protein